MAAMEFWDKIFKKKNNRYAIPILMGAVSLLLLAVVLVCDTQLAPELVAGSYFLSIVLLLLYFLFIYFTIGTVVKVLTIATRLKYHPTLKFFLIIAILLIVRMGSVALRLPRLQYCMAFFTQSGCLENFYAESVGVLFIDACIFLAVAVFGTKYFAAYGHPFTTRHRRFAGWMMGAQLLAVLVLSGLLPYIVGHVASEGRFALNPCSLMSFDGNSVMLLFIFFGYGYGTALFLDKIFSTIYLFFHRKLLPTFLLVACAFAFYVVFCFLCKPLFFGFPVVIWLIFIVVYMAFSFMGMMYGRQNYRFFIVLGHILLFSFILSLLVSYHVQKNHGMVRRELVDKLITSLPGDSRFPDGVSRDSVSPGSVDDFFDRVYSSQTLPIGFAWVVKSGRHLDRDVIMSYPDETAQSSFAYYVDGRLVDQYGGYDYNLCEDVYLNNIRYDNRHDCIILNGYQHYVYKISDNELVIVSHRVTSQYSLLSAFSFYFIVNLLFFLLTLLVKRPFIRVSRPLSLYSNLLWLVLVTMLFVGIAFCGLSVYHYMSRWEGDRVGLIKSKLGKAQIELNKSVGQLAQIKQSRGEEEMNAILSRLTKQYDLYLALYDEGGRRLYYSPTDRVLQPLCLPDPVMEMMRTGNTYCRVRELTDYRDTYHIYKAVMDEKGNVVGYFSGADVRNRYANDIKVSNLISRQLHFFAWVILFFAVSSFLFYFIIYRSMGALRNAMRKRNRPYSPIRLDWEVNEEIGALIQEHNQMVDELRANAVQMAKSERETAWREMALEIAHEVKNPLTPMRLKMQMLQKAWLSNRPDIGDRICDAADEVIRQTDALAEVSDTFSEFAASQSCVNSDMDVRKLLEEQVGELQTLVPARCSLKIGSRPEYRALVNRDHFRQMMLNLVKNAYHNRREHGRLSVTIVLDDAPDDAYWLLTFASDDRGFDRTDEASVFSVKFSPENCGHSLCLPIVKNIVVSFNGEITFETSPESGTKFFIKIPKL